MTDERLRRWRLVLGEPADEELGAELSGTDLGMDGALAALYDSDRKTGLGATSPNVARWLGDIREYFPTPVVQVMQKDALERLKLDRMLLEPELLANVVPDVHLVATLLSLSKVIPNKTKATAREVVRRVVEDLERKLRNPLQQAVRGALARSARTRRPRANAIDWHRTIRKNLHTTQTLRERRVIVAERLVGYARRSSSLRDVVLCVDQSGSMAASVVYASIFGAVLASLKALTTRMVVYDTAVVDLTEDLADPVDLLFGAQLGGGNDTPKALAYCQSLITRPQQTILVLISDLFEGALSDAMVDRVASLTASGVQVVCLLALSDRGQPAYDARNAARFAALGVPSFACTPELFPDLMAAAIQRQDLAVWAARNDIVTARKEG
jgi:hypothetical protein